MFSKFFDKLQVKKVMKYKNSSKKTLLNKTSANIKL